MAKREKRSDDGSECPPSSARLPGGIETAARSTMEAESYELGYPEKRESIHMNQTQRVASKR
jgi:hypothetical protein